MRIAVIGTGYVGLVTGTCLAETGNDVICMDSDREKIERLSRGESPIYEPGLTELIRRGSLDMSPESAEMTKCAANALLSTKISFMNEIAGVCERSGADIDEVRRGIGHDSRIGFAFLFPGCGYGGSCFPKDVCGLAAVARSVGVTLRILEAVHDVNERQKCVILEKMRDHFQGRLAGKTLAVWGLAFTPGTDDIREAPALALIDHLLAAGVNLRVYDPEAMANVRRRYGDRLYYGAGRDDVLDGADGLAILTEWKEFIHPDFELMRTRLRTAVIFDGRNLCRPRRMAEAGFTYYSIGRQAVRPPETTKSE